MPDTIHFQDPDTGVPLVLVKRDMILSLPVVTVGDADDYPQDVVDEAAAAAEKMTAAIAAECCTDLYQAARLLWRRFGADL